jgi:hypothetical protein
LTTMLLGLAVFGLVVVALAALISREQSAP